MKAKIYKFIFMTPVHFGNGTLDSAEMCFSADTLFSALFIEALGMGNGVSENFRGRVLDDKILFSDALPYSGDTLYLPKPVRPIKKDSEKNERSAKKKFKNLNYIPLEEFSDYMKGDFDIDSYNAPEFGKTVVRTQVSIRGEEQSVPYRTGIFSFNEDCGLYIIVAYENEDDANMVDEMIDRLSYSGVGGKRYSGMGKFDYVAEDIPNELENRINAESEEYMQLSIGYPDDDELDEALKEASYMLCKRSGFVASLEYADQAMRKTDSFLFTSGSCFRKRYRGTILEVSGGKGGHPVYRYAKPLFLGVDV